MKPTQVDLVVIGAGPAGLSAASEVARRGGRVAVVDENSQPGGRLLIQVHRDPKDLLKLRGGWINGRNEAEKLVVEARKAGAEIECGLSVWNVFHTGSNWLICVVPTDPGNPHSSAISDFQADALLLATGAKQNPLPFAGWTLPGVLTAGAAMTMINCYGILPGNRALVVGCDPLGISAAQLLSACGVRVLGLVLPPNNGLQFGPATPLEALERLIALTRNTNSRMVSLFSKSMDVLKKPAVRLYPQNGVNVCGIPFMLRRSIRSASGGRRVEEAEIVAVNAEGRDSANSRTKWPVDVIVTSAELSPLTELAQLAGCPLIHVSNLGGWVPVHGPNLETLVPGLFLAGSMTSIEGASVAETQGRIAGLTAASYLGLIKASDIEREYAVSHRRLDNARNSSIPFLSDIEAGRREMCRHWISSHDSFPRNP